MIPKYKDIVDLIKKGSTLEAQEKIMELREAAVELQDENQELREKIKSLEEKLELKESLEWERPYYWVRKNDEKDGPFCQLCYDKDGGLIRLQFAGNGTWNCKSCKSIFRDESYVAPKMNRKPRGGDWLIR